MIIGTRGSQLALAQAETVARLLKAQGVETSLKIIKTSGDRFTDRPLHAVSVELGLLSGNWTKLCLKEK